MNLLHDRNTHEKARPDQPGFFAFSRRLLRGFQLDHVTGDGGGVAGQNPGPEPVFLNLRVDHCIAALGLDGRVLRAHKSAVLADRDDAKQQQAGGRCFAVANHGVLVAVVMGGFHRGAGATCQNHTEQCGGDYFAEVFHSKTPWGNARDPSLGRRAF